MEPAIRLLPFFMLILSLSCSSGAAQLPSGALVSAIEKGDTGQLLTERSVPVDTEHPYIGGYTLLHLAVHYDQREIITLLVSNGANLEAKNDRSLTPLFLAVEMNNPQVAELLIKLGSDVSCLNNDGLMPVHFAVSKGFIPVVELLLENGVNIDVKTAEYDLTPLMIASASGRLSMAEFLIEKGANVNAWSTKKNMSVLSISNMVDDRDMARLLRQHGAEAFVGPPSTGTVDSDGPTDLSDILPPSTLALFLTACARGDLKEIKAGLATGQDIQCSDMNGNSPLHLAVRSGCLAPVKHLVEKGAQIESSDVLGYTPLHTAVVEGHNDIVDFLLTHGASVNAKTRFGDTPMILAARENRIIAARKLINCGARVQTYTRRGEFPLYIAAEKGYPYFVQLLLKNGADRSAHTKNREKSTAFEAARQGKKTKVVQVFEMFKTAEPEPVGLTQTTPEDPVLSSTRGDRPPAEGTSESGFSLFFLVAFTCILFLVVVGLFLFRRKTAGKTESGSSDGGEDSVEMRSVKRIASGEVDTAMSILATGSDSQPDEHGDSMLHKAVIAGSVPMIEALLGKGFFIDTKNHEGMTSLHLAVADNSSKIVTLLISHGANVHERGKNGFTPLMIAVSKKCPEVARILVEQGAKVDVFCDKGFTPLVGACLVGSGTIVKLLLDNGADVNLSCMNMACLSPLAAAVSTKNMKLARYLVKKGAVIPR